MPFSHHLYLQVRPLKRSIKQRLHNKKKTRPKKSNKENKIRRNESYLWASVRRKGEDNWFGNISTSCQCPYPRQLAEDTTKKKHVHIIYVLPSYIGRANEATEIQITKFTSHEKGRKYMQLNVDTKPKSKQYFILL